MTVSIEPPDDGTDDPPARRTSTLDARGRIVVLARRLDGPGADASGAAEPLRFPLERRADSALWQGEASFPAEGVYRLAVHGLERFPDRPIRVRDPTAAELELAEPAARPDFLREIAAIGGGDAIALPQLRTLVSGLDLSPIRERWSERRPLWDDWLVLAALALLLATEWTLRKWRHLP